MSRLSVAVVEGPVALAIRLAGFGHDVSLVRTTALDDADQAVCRELGVELVLAPELDVVVASRWLTPSYRLYRAVRGAGHDALVFEARGGVAYCAGRAKQVGVDFESATLVIRVGAPMHAAAERSRTFLTLAEAGEIVTERLALELADVLVEESGVVDLDVCDGWTLPERRYAVRAGDDPESPELWTAALSSGWRRVFDDARRPLVSVVIPFHERTAYLGFCLEALARQTYPALEVVVADDGSASGGAARYLSELEARTWPWPLRVIHLPRGGVSSARNAGAQAASGDAVVFVDDDDVPFHDFAEVLARGLETSGADVVAAGARTFRDEGAPVGRPGDKITISFGRPRELGLIGNHYGHPTCLWRREVFRSQGGFRDIGVMEDWELLARAALGGVRIAATPDPLFWYRHTGRGRFTAGTPAQRSEGRVAIAQLYAQRLPDGFRLLPRLAVGAYEELERGAASQDSHPSRPFDYSRTVAQRVGAVWREEGTAEVGRRAWERVRRLTRAGAGRA